MIQLRTAIRVYPAAWLAPVLIVLCVWYARSMVFRADPDPYLTGLSAQSLTTQGLVAPVVAALAAWEAARLRRGGVWELPIARSRLTVAAWPAGFIWLVGTAAVTAGVLSIITTKGFLIPDLRPLSLAALVVAAHTLAGFALGLLLPIVVAAPVAMGAALLWQVMPRAIQPLWTHVLTSQQLEACCATATDIADAALVAPALVAGGVAVASVIVILARRSRLRLVAAAGALAVGLAAGSVVASTQLDGDAWVPRDESALVCEAGPPEVCVWPEHASRLTEVAGIARAAAAGWGQFGVAVPARFDEAYLSPRREGVLSFGFGLHSSRDEIVSSMAYAMVPPFIQCPGAFVGFEAFDPLYAWYATTAGVSHDGLEHAFGRHTVLNDKPVLALVEEVRSLPPDQQTDWVLRNEWAMGACDRNPQLEVVEP